MSEISIRNAVLSDIPDILEVVRSVGRYIGFEDELLSWMTLDPQALVIAESIQPKKLVGVCSGMAYGPDRGFMGLYMVREECRGRGIGTELWNRAMKHLEGRNIGVRSIDNKINEYRDKHGFLHQSDYAVCYYECLQSSLPLPKRNPDSLVVVSLTGKGVWPRKPTLVATTLDSKDLKCDLMQNTSECSSEIETSYSDTLDNIIVEEWKDTRKFGGSIENLLTNVVTYDRLLHGYDRSFIVTQTLSWRSCKTKIAMDSEKVLGYGCLRPTVTGHLIISPFYSDSQDIAELLLFSLLSEVNFSEIIKGILIRFPDKNLSCLKLLQKYGFRDTGLQILTCYNKTCVEFDLSRIYSFHSSVFCSE